MSTINNDIPFVPENTTDPAAGLNLSLNVIDALLQIAVVAIQNDPPVSPTEGQRYIVGAAGAGAWSGQNNRLARYLDGAWSFYDARMAVNLSDGNLYIRDDSGWAVASGGGGSSTWGGITGTLTDQTDLVTELSEREYTLTAGSNITIDRTDPAAPVISASGGGGGHSTWGGITGTLTDQTDLADALDELEYALTAGTNITIDRTDPYAPVISASGALGVASVVAGTNITVDNTDPANPIISATGGGGGGITSPTITQIITSTDPEEPTSPGDLLIVLPVPRVVAASYSEHTYGGADSLSSLDVVIPADTEEDDMILVLVSSSYPVATPSGYTLAASQDSVRSVSSTGIGWSHAFIKTSAGTEGGTTVTLSQSTSGRIAAVAVVVRSPTGVTVVDASANNYVAAAITNPGLHIVPPVTATEPGQMAVTTQCCALALSDGDTTVTLPSRWTSITPTVAPMTPSYGRMRSWAAYAYPRSGETISGTSLHDTSSHDGSSLTLLLGAL